MLKVLGVADKPKRDAMIGVMIPAAIRAELERIAESDSRSLSFVAGALLERGLELFRQDGLLRAKGKDNKLGVIRAKTEDSSRKKVKP